MFSSVSFKQQNKMKGYINSIQTHCIIKEFCNITITIKSRSRVEISYDYLFLL